ncbi:MAG: DUF1501 domain-containing protein [Lentisphaeraceae bacterium]|nr:DUF1501 domain-containing protein [Lentisphaeraceae bacterium]
MTSHLQLLANPFPSTIQYLMGVDHEKLTYKFQSRYFRLIDVHGHVLKDINS